MADEQNNGASRKRELIAELQRARSNMSRNMGHVRYRADVGARVQDSMKSNAGAWLAGAVVTGVLAGWRMVRPRLRERKVFIDASTGKKIDKLEKRGFLMGIVAFVFSLLQPALTTLVTRRLNALAQKHVGA